MSEQITIQIPVCFPGTPAKHRSPKLIYGTLPLVIDVPVAPKAEVNEGFEVCRDKNWTSFVEYEGVFYRSLGALKFPDIHDVIVSNIQPVENTSSWIKDTERKAKARSAGMKLFPDTGNEPSYSLPEISLESISDNDLASLTPLFNNVRARMSCLRVINQEVCKPISEPIFMVCLIVGRHGEASEIRVEMTSVETKPPYLGCPVAYFRADQQQEANAYAQDLASNLGVEKVKQNARAIKVHNPHLLNADPHLLCLLELADWAARQLKDGNGTAGDNNFNNDGTEIARGIRSIVGEDEKSWRKAPTLPLTEEQRIELESLVRQAMEFEAVSIPEIVFKTAMERWEERPVDFSKEANPKPYSPYKPL